MYFGSTDSKARAPNSIRMPFSYIILFAMSLELESNTARKKKFLLATVISFEQKQQYKR